MVALAVDWRAPPAAEPEMKAAPPPREDAGKRGRRIRLQLPSPDDPEFTHTPAQGWQREPAKARQLWEQAVRQRWRALLLMVKAKLEAIASGIVTWDEEFLPYTVLATGQTVSEWVEENGFLALGGAVTEERRVLPPLRDAP
jgi:hypothetical protein